MHGKRFTHYEVLEKLGSGGMGDVYRARDLSLGREVAMKFLPGRFAGDSERLVRFEQEARAASSLNHPNIVTIHEIGQADGVPYIVMELVRGHTLRVLLAGGRLSFRRILEVGAQAAEGLAKAHGAGIVHRDLKPENLMITDDGFLKILDFGLAKLLAPHSDPSHPAGASSDADTQSLIFGQLDGAAVDTAQGVLLGTASYMSPEQARGRAVDFRSDHFSLGSILYEMVTQRRAFEGETPVQTLSAIIEDPPPPLAVLNPAVPPPLRWIIERCLAKEPEGRYASTLDLAREIRGVLGRLEEVSSGAPSLSAPSRRRRAWAASAAVMGALLVAGVVVASRGGAWSEWLRPRRVPAEKQIAVLPFASDAADAATRVFGDGLAEALTTKLTQLEQFQGSFWVVPAGEVRQAGVTSAAAAHRTFGANLVVSGQLQRQGDRVRLTASVVDAVAGRQLRSDSIEARVDDVGVWQDGVVDRIVEMLEVRADPKARKVLRAGGTQVPGAYELYLEGRSELQRYENAESLDRAIGLFQQALQQDPGYALAYAGMGEAHWRRYQLTKDRHSVELAQKSCRRGVELNDLLAPVHVTLGMLHRETGRHEEAVEDFRRALALDPSSVDAHLGLAHAYEALARAEEAEVTYRKAVALRPGYWAGHNNLGAFYYGRGRYDEAAAAFRRVLELTPDNVRGYSNLGGLYQVMGRYDEAEAMLRRSVDLRPTADALSNLGTLQFFRGRYTEAARSFEQALALRDEDFRLWYNLAAARYWTPGAREAARDAYERAARLAEKDRELNPRDAGLLVRLADCYAMTGRTALARTLVGDALRLGADDADVLYRAGHLHEQLGNRRQALALLDKALARGYSPDEIRRAPGLEGLRADPGFKAPKGGDSNKGAFAQ